MRSGSNLAVIDLLPPDRQDPQGMQGEFVEALCGETHELPEGKPLTFASYSAGSTPAGYLDHPAAGDALPEMQLFLTASRYVNLPLPPTYAAAYRGVPEFWREVIEGKRLGPNTD